jgi:hypothetical protein
MEMDDHDALDQLRADILVAFSAGPQRDAWLVWLNELAADSMWREGAQRQVLH